MLLTLIYDGGCPFCREFALRSELKAGVPNLRIVDGRADHSHPSHELNALGLPLRNGAVLIEGEQRWHGSEAIAELSRRMKPSDPLLKLAGQAVLRRPTFSTGLPRPFGSPAHGSGHTRAER